LRKTLLTKKYGVIEAEIDNELQLNNKYTEWGMYLINVEGGVVWGYDADKYMFIDDDIVKKQK
jgi:hypothetical protein